MTIPPTPPTDNLYKFMALGGLTLLVSAYVVRLLDLRSLRSELTQERISIGQSSLEIQYLKQDLEKALGRPAKEIPDKDIPPAQEAKLRELEMKDVRLKVIVKEQEALVNELEGDQWSFRVGMFLGAVLTWAGFRLWYYRLQKPQDELLRNQVAKARQDGAESAKQG